MGAFLRDVWRVNRAFVQANLKISILPEGTDCAAHEVCVIMRRLELPLLEGRPLNVMCGPFMVRETIAAWRIIHAAQVGEEIHKGGEMGQEVADLHAPLIIFARSHTQDAVLRAELSISSKTRSRNQSGR